MAYGSNPGGGNPGGGGDYFSDAAETPSEPKPEMGEEKSEGAPTGILPKSLMAGKDFKPGEEIVLKVVAVHDNDFEVEYSHDESGEEKKGEYAAGGGTEEGSPGTGTPSMAMNYMD